MTTLQDVAKLRVSPMTVSRVINDSGYVSEKTRERVQRAIAELDYVPNALARSLRFKQTKTIALIISDITDPFFTTLARSVEDAASEQGFSVIFCKSTNPDKETEYLNVVIQKQVDGVLLVPAFSSLESIEFLQDCGVPFVVLDRRVPGLDVDIVRCDSKLGAYELTRHLLDLGHERIAALSGSRQVTTAADRVAGYRRALIEAGLGEHAIEFYGDYTAKSGYEMAKQALATKQPTALFGANNFIVLGAMRAVRETNLRVPDDISVVAFDDLLDVIGLEPFLTVIRQPAYEIGWQATALLLDGCRGRSRASRKRSFCRRSSSSGSRAPHQRRELIH